MLIVQVRWPRLTIAAQKTVTEQTKTVNKKKRCCKKAKKQQQQKTLQIEKPQQKWIIGGWFRLTKRHQVYRKTTNFYLRV